MKKITLLFTFCIWFITLPGQHSSLVKVGLTWSNATVNLNKNNMGTIGTGVAYDYELIKKIMTVSVHAGFLSKEKNFAFLVCLPTVSLPFKEEVKYGGGALFFSLWPSISKGKIKAGVTYTFTMNSYAHPKKVVVMSGELAINNREVINYDFHMIGASLQLEYPVYKNLNLYINGSYLYTLDESPAYIEEYEEHCNSAFDKLTVTADPFHLGRYLVSLGLGYGF